MRGIAFACAVAAAVTSGCGAPPDEGTVEHDRTALDVPSPPPAGPVVRSADLSFPDARVRPHYAWWWGSADGFALQIAGASIVATVTETEGTRNIVMSFRDSNGFMDIPSRGVTTPPSPLDADGKFAIHVSFGRPELGYVEQWDFYGSVKDDTVSLWAFEASAAWYGLPTTYHGRSLPGTFIRSSRYTSEQGQSGKLMTKSD